MSYPCGLLTNPWSYFDRIVLINLPSRADRMMDCVTEFRKVGLKDYTVVRPVYHADAELSLINTVCREVYRARHDGVQRLLILEDDVTFINDTVKNLLAAIMVIHYEEWKLFYLGATVNSRLELRRPGLLQVKFAFATHAIAYHHSMFDDLLSILRPYAKKKYLPLDRIYVNYIQPNYSCYMITPMVAIQRPGFSDILGREVEYDQLKRYYRFIHY